MPKVLVVSRNPAMAMGLSATAHDIIDLKPPTFGEWISGPEDVDAFVLDLESPTLAAAAVVNLRAHGKSSPALLVSNDARGWDQADLADLVSTQVLPQPVTRAALLAALDEMLAGRSGEETEPFIAPEGPPDDHAPLHTVEALSELLRDEDGIASTHHDDEIELLVSGTPPRRAVESPTISPARPVDGSDTTMEPPVPQDPSPTVRGSAGPSRRRRPAPPKPREPEAEEQPKLSAVPRTRRSTAPPSQPTRATSSQVLDDLDQLRSPAKAPEAPARPRHAAKNKRRAPRAGVRTKEQGAGQVIVSDAPGRSPDAAVALVRDLAPLVADLFSVPETASVVVTDAVERCHADAGVLMVPDAGSWRVSAGVHLRPLEYRIELDSESWLVCELARRNRGAIIEDTDIARERLQGAPLASWRHLLAVPVPDVQALLMVARRDEPAFNEEDLAVLASLGAEADSLLGAAVETRSLARQLSEFTDDGSKSL